MVKILRFAAEIPFLSGLLTLPPFVATRPRHAERCAPFATGLGTGCRPGEREGTGGSLLLYFARWPGCMVLLEFTATRVKSTSLFDFAPLRRTIPDIAQIANLIMSEDLDTTPFQLTFAPGSPAGLLCQPGHG